MIALVMQLSCDLGYTHMRFETGALQIEAVGLYRSLGFKRVAPTKACPEAMRPDGYFYDAAPCAA